MYLSLYHFHKLLKPLDSNFLCFLEFENELFWQFKSPILLDSTEPELTDLDATLIESIQIGMVRVLISKHQLDRTRDNTIIANVVVPL